jgi:cytochrome c oxidase subunit 3
MSGAYWMGDIKFVLGAVVVGIIFLFFQFIEIYLSGFNITQLGYSSCFFLATGFHGFHVLLGAFLLICLYSNRIIDNLIDSFFIFQSKVIHLHTFATATILYWHFVDVIWIGLYYFLYFLPFVFVV